VAKAANDVAKEKEAATNLVLKPIDGSKPVASDAFLEAALQVARTQTSSRRTAVPQGANPQLTAAP
jgi:hypothetical protein